MKIIEKAISIAVLFSIVLCSCGRDSANLARRNDDNIAAGAVSQDASVAKQGDKWLEAGGGQVANANALAESLQTTADISKSLNFAGTKGTQKQNDYFEVSPLSNDFVNVVERARIEELVASQMRVQGYDNNGIDKGINKTREEEAFISPLNNRALSFHGDVGKGGNGNNKKAGKQCFRELDDNRLWIDKNWKAELGLEWEKWLVKPEGKEWLRGMQALRFLYDTLGGHSWLAKPDGQRHARKMCSEFQAMPGREDVACWSYYAAIGDGPFTYGEGVKKETLSSLLTWYWMRTATEGKAFRASGKAEEYFEKTNWEAFKECEKEEPVAKENKVNTDGKEHCSGESAVANDEQTCDSEEVETFDWMNGPTGQMVLTSFPGQLWLNKMDQGKRYKSYRDAINESFEETKCGRIHRNWVQKTEAGAEYAAGAENYSLCSAATVTKDGKRITRAECIKTTPESSRLEWIGRQGDWYWQGRVKAKGGTKGFFKDNENIDWIFKKGIGLLFMATQAWLDVLNAGVDSKFEGLPIGWSKFWESDIFLNFADLESGQEFWTKRGLDFSGTKVGEKFLTERGLEFSGTKAGEEFWTERGLDFSVTKVGEEFWTDNGLEFSETEVGEKFWKKSGLEFSGTKVGEKFWTDNGLEFSGTKVGEKFWKKSGLEFSRTKVGEKFWRDNGLEFSETEAGEAFWKKRGLKFSETEVGKEFWRDNGLEFSKAEVGKEFWREHGLEFSKTKVGKEFWKKYGLKFSKTKAGEEFWKEHGLEFSKAESGEEFWKEHWSDFSRTKAGKKFLKEHGSKFSETKAGEELKKASGFFGRLWRGF